VPKSKSVVIPQFVSNLEPKSAVSDSVIDPSQILTLDEIASRLKTSRRWVYEKSRRRCLDPLPVVRIGRYLRFYWPDVSAWLRKNSRIGAA
jgi:predicted DNA-binding transcriptional regulator AlpA